MARKKAESLPITAARGRLFGLVEEVLSGERERVELTLRGREEAVVLVRKTLLEGLEADVAALRAQTALETKPLRGLGRLNVAAEEILVRSRARQSALAEAKRSDIVRRGGG